MTIIVEKGQAIIEVPYGFNFKRWNEDVCFAFVMAEIDIALRVPKPTAINADNTTNKWSLELHLHNFCTMIQFNL